MPSYSNCIPGTEFYRSHSRYKEKGTGYIPQLGDVIMFWRTDSKTGARFIGHTGIVIGYNSSNNTVTTIEGNANQAIRTKNYPLNSSEIHGYGLNGGVTDNSPKKPTSSTTPKKETKVTTLNKKGRVNLNVLCIRDNASFKSNIIGNLKDKEEVNVLKELNGLDKWYEIQAGSIHGYVLGKFLEVLDEPSSTPSNTTVSNNTEVFVDTVVNVYKLAKDIEIDINLGVLASIVTNVVEIGDGTLTSAFKVIDYLFKDDVAVKAHIKNANTLKDLINNLEDLVENDTIYYASRAITDLVILGYGVGSALLSIASIATALGEEVGAACATVVTGGAAIPVAVPLATVGVAQAAMGAAGLTVSATMIGNAGKEIKQNVAKTVESKEKSANLTKEQLKGKPKNSPNPDKWVKKNGTISIDNNGVWTYHDWQGNSVSYPNGYPDFKSAGMVKQEVSIGEFKSYPVDFPKANKLAPNGPKSTNSTWHHHQDGTTMQEIAKEMHRRFTHRGGMSCKNKVI